jgi:hypothetical protein
VIGGHVFLHVSLYRCPYITGTRYVADILRKKVPWG